jgi:heme/copper-type cytochrome/quinol oxidase subunit 1
VLGGLVYWAPIIWGGRFPEGPSLALAGGGLVGTIVLCLPDLISGFLDQGALLGGASDNTDAIEALNIVSLIGGVILVLIAVGFVGLLLKVGRTSTDDDDLVDPWEGHTLEWAGAEPPAVTSEAPVYDARHGEVPSS